MHGGTCRVPCGPGLSVRGRPRSLRRPGRRGRPSSAISRMKLATSATRTRPPSGQTTTVWYDSPFRASMRMAAVPSDSSIGPASTDSTRRAVRAPASKNSAIQAASRPGASKTASVTPLLDPRSQIAPGEAQLRDVVEGQRREGRGRAIPARIHAIRRRVPGRRAGRAPPDPDRHRPPGRPNCTAPTGRTLPRRSRSQARRGPPEGRRRTRRAHGTWRRNEGARRDDTGRRPRGPPARMPSRRWTFHPHYTRQWCLCAPGTAVPGLVQLGVRPSPEAFRDGGTIEVHGRQT